MNENVPSLTLDYLLDGGEIHPGNASSFGLDYNRFDRVMSRLEAFGVKLQNQYKEVAYDDGRIGVSPHFSLHPNSVDAAKQLRQQALVGNFDLRN